MDLKSLQNKYPEFVYESFDWKIEGGDLAAVFRFTMGDVEFNPGVTVKGVDTGRVEAVGGSVTDNLVFNMGLAEIPSYWKAACAPTIVIKAGYLDRTAAAFWQDLIVNMGQFFYENNLPFIKPRIRVDCDKPKNYPAIFKKNPAARYLVPMGGGKDSLVTLEILKEKKADVGMFTLNANRDLEKVVAKAGGKNIFVKRTIDKKIVELNSLGYFNGHTPFSSILAVLGVALAAISDFRYVAISQERSSNEGNVKYLGKTVNHQYTKAFEFENKFRAYSKKYLAKKIGYFSFLRPLYEMQITGIFSRYQKYFGTFMSCNKPFTIAARENGTTGWCGNCAKCLSIFSMIYPFIGKDAAVKIFSKNLFEDENLMPTMLEMTGQAAAKPFECVGTTQESLAAFYLSLKITPGEKPCLLKYFEENILPKHRGLGQKAKRILSAWNGRHNVPRSLAAGLKKEATGIAGDVDNFG